MNENNTTNGFRNMMRHAFVALGAMAYLGAVPLLLYQYFGMLMDWPGVFLHVVHDANGDWWLDADWNSPVPWASMGVVLLSALIYGMLRRKDDGHYREPDVTSQPGF